MWRGLDLVDADFKMLSSGMYDIYLYGNAKKYSKWIPSGEIRLVFAMNGLE